MTLPSARRPFLAAASFLIYVACVPIANLMVQRWGIVPVGFGLMAPAGVFMAGMALTARDFVQLWSGRWAAVAAILAGTALSFLLSTPALAVASGSAFILAELLDMAVWTPLQSRSLTSAVLLSNTVGAVADSVVFLSLAFGSLAFLPGQVWGKLLMTIPVLAVLVPLRIRARRNAI